MSFNIGILRSRISRLCNVFFRNPMYLYNRIKCSLLAPFYQSIILPQKVRKIRSKEIIDVIFILNELGSWKTESLYNRMKEHSRFRVRLLLVHAKETPNAIEILKRYLQDKKYTYDEIRYGEKQWNEKFNSDIIFYQKPYDGVIGDKYFFSYHTKSLFCYVLYCFRNRNYPEIKNIRFIRFIWQFYAENKKVIEESVPVFSTHAENYINTGLPIMDDLLLDKSCFKDPWKKCGKKKRIIYAPHHTIECDIYEYATFLDYCDFMFELAEKYKDKVQWAFKPHPVLKEKLKKVWGEDRTNEYYGKWESLVCGQLSSGEYLSLFKFSDAMIHDCGSFKLEYLYTGNPVMYLQKKEPVFDYSNWQTEQALRLHYKGYDKSDIENFVVNVINGEDSLKDDREKFVKEYLTPPNNKTACQNIINAILGAEEYKDA